MKKCKYCQADLEENTTLCPSCGRDNAAEEAPVTDGETAPVSAEETVPVSYTHLTLPTICSV